MCGKSANWRDVAGRPLIFRSRILHYFLHVSAASQSLIDAYVAALPLAAVSVVSCDDESRSKIESGVVGGAHGVLWFKQSHLDLILSSIAIDDWAEMPPNRLMRLIEDTAESLGARIRTDEEIRRSAADQVAAVRSKVDGMNASGGLKEFNQKYKAHRQAKAATGERAMSYSAFLGTLTRKMVEEVARLVG